MSVMSRNDGSLGLLRPKVDLDCLEEYTKGILLNEVQNHLFSHFTVVD